MQVCPSSPRGSFLSSFSSSTDIVLFSVDRESTVTYFEGSSSVSGPALRATKDQNLVGQPLRIVWPDIKLEAAVQQIFSTEQVSPIPGHRGSCCTDPVWGLRNRFKS